jgi:thiol-disulfide isomerase/thioredoxin
MIKRIILYFALLIIPAFFIFSFAVFQLFKYFEERDYNADYWRGKSLPYDKFYDTEGNLSKIDFPLSDYTVLDFWFVGCPWCIKEMVHFDELLNKHNGKIQIYSLSTDRVSLWKSFVTDESLIKNERLKFLAKKNDLWHHLSLSEKEEKVANYWPLAREKFKVSRYPTYFIFDKSGKIVTVTNSLTKFVQAKLEGKSEYFLFLQNLPEWNYKKKFAVAFVFLYSIGIVVLVVCIPLFNSKRNQKRA